MQEEKNKITDNNEKAKSKARLLKALADRGIGGEKENAIKKLKEHLKKHNLSLGDIDSSLNDRCFKVRNQDDRTILMNVILSVNPFTKINEIKTSLIVNLDDEDYQEVLTKFKYFAKLFRADKDTFVMAFFKKNEYFFRPDEITKNKWREKHNVNEHLSEQQLKVDEINSNVLSAKTKDDLNNKMFSHLKKLERMTKMLDGLQEAEYSRLHKTIT